MSPGAQFRVTDGHRCSQLHFARLRLFEVPGPAWAPSSTCPQETAFSAEGLATFVHAFDLRMQMNEAHVPCRQVQVLKVQLQARNA